uniref:Uncharacterized protein n=1 Tax=Romanomermis culicivorax TaxID=13658 RepID=A0A915I664_ROMCU
MYEYWRTQNREQQKYRMAPCGTAWRRTALLVSMNRTTGATGYCAVPRREGTDNANFDKMLEQFKGNLESSLCLESEPRLRVKIGGLLLLWTRRNNKWRRKEE